MQTTNTTLSPALDPVKDNWSFLEVWIDPMQSPPYMLLLMGDSLAERLRQRAGSCSIFDPAEGYRPIKGCGNYEEAMPTNTIYLLQRFEIDRLTSKALKR